MYREVLLNIASGIDCTVVRGGGGGGGGGAKPPLISGVLVEPPYFWPLIFLVFWSLPKCSKYGIEFCACVLENCPPPPH